MENKLAALHQCINSSDIEQLLPNNSTPDQRSMTNSCDNLQGSTRPFYGIYGTGCVQFYLPPFLYYWQTFYISLLTILTAPSYFPLFYLFSWQDLLRYLPLPWTVAVWQSSHISCWFPGLAPFSCTRVKRIPVVSAFNRFVCNFPHCNVIAPPLILPLLPFHLSKETVFLWTSMVHSFIPIKHSPFHNIFHSITGDITLFFTLMLPTI